MPARFSPVNRITKPDVAALAGVDLEYVTRLIDAGVLAPAGDGAFTQGDARRARLYLGLERAGLPFGALVEALERGELSFDFLDLPVYDRFSPLSRRSFRDVSAQESIPVELLLVVRDAMGLAQASADDQVREDELQLVPLIKLQLSKGFDRAVVEQSLRVYGDTLRRIAEAEADWWHTQILLPSLASGMNAAEMASRISRAATTPSREFRKWNITPSPNHFTTLPPCRSAGRWTSGVRRAATSAAA